MSNDLNILVVDDNKDMVSYLKSYLSRRGHHVVGVYNVAQALDAIEENVFDAMIVDVCLDNISGVSLLKSVKNRGDLSPVIMMSGYASQEMAMECLSLGAYDFLFKPFRLQVLEDILLTVQNRKARLTRMGVMV